MKIALLGTRGIPANYGGFETFAEEVAARLSARGHDVIVYCRSHYAPSNSRTCRGARLVILPTIRAKYLDTPVHTLLSCLHLMVEGADAAIFCNSGNAVFTYWPRLSGIPAVLNVDGLEHKRRKWKRLARAWFRLSERLVSLCPDAVVTDARVIQRYFARRHGLSTHYIAYGAPKGPVPTSGKLRQLGLKEGEYFLYVSRFEPENNALLVVREFERCTTARKLVMVGHAPYAAAYIRRVKETRDPRIVFPGAVYGRGYAELQSHCLAYIHATEVGGTHPALVEAMGRRNAILYLDTPENCEVAGRAGLPFEVHDGSLRDRIEQLDKATPEQLRAMGCGAWAEARARYDWAAVADSYERVLRGLAKGP